MVGRRVHWLKKKSSWRCRFLLCQSYHIGGSDSSNNNSMNQFKIWLYFCMYVSVNVRIRYTYIECEVYKNKFSLNIKWLIYDHELYVVYAYSYMPYLHSVSLLLRIYYIIYVCIYTHIFMYFQRIYVHSCGCSRARSWLKVQRHFIWIMGNRRQLRYLHTYLYTYIFRWSGHSLGKVFVRCVTELC